MSYSFLDLAYEVLKDAPHPMKFREIWQAAEERSFNKKLKTVGKTPWQSLGSQLYMDVRDNLNSRFMQVGTRPKRFFLKERESELTVQILNRMEKRDQKKETGKSNYHERDLHPLLTYYAAANPSFFGDRSVNTKTILHEKSKKKGYNEWIHPDIVGFYLPLEDWEPNVIEFNRLSDNNSLRLFSFEIKKELTKANYRESYFQAVSNSSWAHAGYLVAAEILQDDEFLAELERLASSFGIGIIQLDLSDFGSSRILYQARFKDTLDWETINKLCKQNSDFQGFLKSVQNAFKTFEIHETDYDKIVDDIEMHIQNLFVKKPTTTRRH